MVHKTQIYELQGKLQIFAEQLGAYVQLYRGINACSWVQFLKLFGTEDNKESL
jgi:hypothetical protein